MINPMLAISLNPVSIEKGEYLASAKLDGIRCLYHKGKLFTRSLKSVPNKYVNEVICAVLSRFESSEDLVLDGELIVTSETDPMCYRETVSSVMSEDTRDFKITYVLFDLYKISEPERSAVDRLFYLRSLFPYNSFENESELVNVKLLPQSIIQDFEVQETSQIYLDKGYEGLMLKPCDAKYKKGRASKTKTELIKIKPNEDAEAEIIGFTQKFHNENEVIINELGYSSRSSHKANMAPVEALGSLIARFNGVEFEIGTGFTESERYHIWMNKSEFLGRLVKFKYQNFGNYEKPRCPVYLGVRDKKDL